MDFIIIPIVLLCGLQPFLLIGKYIILKGQQSRKSNYRNYNLTISSATDTFNRVVSLIYFYMVVLLLVVVADSVAHDSFILENIVNNAGKYGDITRSITELTLAVFAFLSLCDPRRNFIFKLEDILNEMHAKFWIILSLSSMIFTSMLELCLPEEALETEDPNAFIFGMILVFLQSTCVTNIIANTIIFKTIVDYLFEKHNVLQEKLHRVYPFDRKIKNEVSLDNLDNQGIITGLDYYFSLYYKRAKKLAKCETVTFCNILHIANKKFIAFSIIVVVVLQVAMSAFLGLCLYNNDVDISVTEGVGRVGLIVICATALILIGTLIVFTFKPLGRQVLLSVLFDSMFGMFFENKTSGYSFSPIKSYRGTTGRRRKFVDSLDSLVVYANLIATDSRVSASLGNDLNDYLSEEINVINEIDICDECKFLPFFVLIYLFAVEGIPCQWLKECLIKHHNITEQEFELAKQIVEYKEYRRC